jgi:hypothetical protein
MPMPFVTPPHLITPGCPECFLAITDDEASVHADFPTQGILEAFVEGFAMKMREKFNVRCGMAPQAEAPNVFVRVIRIDEGSRFLRYMLPFIGVFIGGATTFEVDGHFLKPQGMKQKFHHKLRGYWGLFGGCSKALLARAGRSAGARTAKAFQKVWR